METAESGKRKLALLYVEDEEEPRELIGNSMASEHPEITLYLARDGAEGLELFRQYRPEIVVTDILMPGIDGLQMAEKIREIDPETEVVALTAYSDTSFLLRAIEIGFSHYVLKPIDYDRLFDAIRKSLDVIELRRLVKEQNERIRSFASELERKVEERTRELQESRNELAQRNTKLRDLTATLKAARDRYWSLYNWSPLGYLTLDDDLIIREVNITGAHMLGARRAELRDTSIEKHLSPEIVARLTDAFQKCVQEQHAQVELEIRLADSKFLYVQLHCLPQHDEGPNRKLYRTALVDITRLKEAEDKLRESERLLIQQSRMAAMGDLLNNIAHHWRQPLNALGLNIQQLAVLSESGDLTKEEIDTSVANAMDILLHLSKMIDDFRNFSTPAPEKSLFKVNETVAQAVSLVEEGFRLQGITIEVAAAEDAEIHGYPNELIEVLLNLLINARDVFQERGTEDPKIVVRSWLQEGKSIVTITDNAEGIKVGILDKIFDPFFTTKEQGKGSGVGLFMSKMIIEKNMGGRLTARNVGAGAEFRIEV